MRLALCGNANGIPFGNRIHDAIVLHPFSILAIQKLKLINKVVDQNLPVA